MLLSTLCYLEKDESYLMLHRVKKENDCNRDKWIGVGGKFEEGESPEECVQRETLEETGLTLTHWRFRGLVSFTSDQWPTEYLHLFTSTGFTGTLRPCAEGDLKWVPKDKLRTLPLWAGDHLFLDLLARDAPFFSLKLRYEGERLVFAALDGRSIDIGVNRGISDGNDFTLRV